MSYYGSWKIDDLFTFYANTTRFDTGNATDADAVPAYRIYEDETGTAILTGNMALLDSTNTAGFYSEQITLSAANGFEKGKSYAIYISATVNGVAGATHHNLQIEAEVDANIVSDKTGYSLANNAITAAVIATDAIDADALADGAITSGTFAAGAIDNTAFNVTETLNADIVSISGDSTAADNLEKEYDGTGYGHILQRTTIATLSTQTSFTLTAGSADNDAYNGCVIVIEDASTAAQKAVGVIADYIGASKTITLLNDPAIFTIAVTDIVTIIADRALKATVDNRTFDVSATGEGGLDWANIGSPTTAQNLSSTNIDVDQVVASVSGAVGSVAAGGITAASIATDAIDADALADGAITAPTFAAGAIDAAAIAADAGTEIGTAVWASASRQLTALDEDVTTLDLNNTAIGSVVSGVTVTTNNDKTGYSLSVAGVQAIWDALTAALTTAGSIGKLLVDNINATISSRSTVTTAQVNAEVVDALATDTYAEPGQESPAATTTLANKINYLYKAFRNKKTQTATTLSLFADDTTTVDQKATISDDGVTYTHGEISTGP